MISKPTNAHKCMTVHYTHRVLPKCFSQSCGSLQRGAMGFRMAIYYTRTVRYRLGSITNIFICILIFSMSFKPCIIFII